VVKRCPQHAPALGLIDEWTMPDPCRTEHSLVPWWSLYYRISVNCLEVYA
jgi:hypothetical protein